MAVLRRRGDGDVGDIGTCNGLLEEWSVEADFTDFSGVAFQDEDFLWLWHAAMCETIRDPEVAQRFDVANPDYEDWFMQFPNCNPVHPYLKSSRPATGTLR